MPQNKRKIRASAFVNDVRSGEKLAEIMKKHGLTTKTLHMVFRKLVDAELMTRDELNHHRSLFQNITDIIGIRKKPRKRVKPPLPIYDSVEPLRTLYLKDVSESGICVEGLNTFVGDRRTFKIKPQGPSQRTTLVFEAKCRWFKQGDGDLPQPQSGFEITDISGYDSKVLEEFLLS